MPCSRSISSKTEPNCAEEKLSCSAGDGVPPEEVEEEPKPKVDQGNLEPEEGLGRGISSSGSESEGWLEDEEEKPW